MNATQTAAIIAEKSELSTTFFVGIASFTALVWDHLVTLQDEIEFIWKRPKGPLIYLFFINRYITPLGFTVNLIAYLSNAFTPETCKHFVRYEGSMTVIGINTTALMMLLRIYAIYDKNRLVVASLASVFALELGVNAWLLSHGIPVRHTAGIHACTMIFGSVKNSVASASAWLPLLYDTIVLVLTLLRTYRGTREASTGKVMRLLLKEGIMYYSVIFSITLILTLMIVFAPDGLKNITAQTEYLMTVAMMSRITLHLKKQMHGGWDSTNLYTTTDEEHTNHWRIRGGSDAVNIAIQKFSVVHDDRGDVVDVPASPSRTKRPMRDRDEWHELGPLRFGINPNNRSAISFRKLV